MHPQSILADFASREHSPSPLDSMEVLIPANTFIASALAVSEIGAKVIPVDVDTDSFLMDMELAQQKITPHTKAIMPVHLFGQSMDMDRVLSFADQYNLNNFNNSIFQ